MFAEYSVQCHNIDDAEELREVIEAFLKKHLDPDYDSDIVVDLETTAG